jgi:hypothetical protein
MSRLGCYVKGWRNHDACPPAAIIRAQRQLRGSPESESKRTLRGTEFANAPTKRTKIKTSFKVLFRVLRSPVKHCVSELYVPATRRDSLSTLVRLPLILRVLSSRA